MQKAIDTHFEVCPKRQIYKCSDCRKDFSEKEYLIKHMDNVHGKKRQYFTYKCPDCEMSFNVKGHLVRHIKMGLHAQQENYPDINVDPTIQQEITIKGISGITKKLVNVGLFTKCVTLKKGKWKICYSCNDCELTFPRKSSVTNHYKTSHSLSSDLARLDQDILEAQKDELDLSESFQETTEQSEDLEDQEDQEDQKNQKAQKDQEDQEESFEVDPKTENISDNEEIIVEPVFETSDDESEIVDPLVVKTEAVSPEKSSKVVTIKFPLIPIPVKLSSIKPVSSTSINVSSKLAAKVPEKRV